VRLLRVGVMTNFNGTRAEVEALDNLRDPYFVNSNAKTRPKVNVHAPAVLTLNPDLVKFVEPSPRFKQIVACRVKIAPGSGATTMAASQALRWCGFHQIPALVTFMRFTHRASFEDFIPEFARPMWTGFKDGSRCKLNNKGKQYAKKWIIALANMFDVDLHICDEKGKGCSECGNCIRLNGYGPDTEIRALDLSASGHCPFNCPDCFSKQLLNRTQGKVQWDKPKRNKKMGRK
jgi:hypothetical protein